MAKAAPDTGSAKGTKLVIAFDSWALSNRFQHHGIGVYSRRLLEGFQQLAPLKEDVIIRPFVKPGSSNGATKFQRSTGFEPKCSSLLGLDRLWRLGGVTAAALKNEADVIFCPYGQVVPLGVVPVVVTIHDTTPLTSPSHTRYVNSLNRAFFWMSAHFSRRILTDSECSKKDLLEIYKLPPEKVRVVYLGYDRDSFNPVSADPEKQKALLKRHGVRAPYILHHGAVQPRKNLERLVRAYGLLRHKWRDLDIQLVLAGQLGWQYEPILEVAKKQRLGTDVILTGALPDLELTLLLKGAAACVIPSLYEGFCLPMVEAMACGIPTIVSNASCLPEVSGGVLRYFNPLLVDEMAEMIHQVLCDTTLRSELILNGLKRAEEFSWERCARESLDALLSSC